LVNHDYGGVNALRVVDGNGAGIPGVTIKSYLKTDYDAGNTSTAFIKAIAETDAAGDWLTPMMLSAATYKLVFEKAGSYNARTQEVVVT